MEHSAIVLTATHNINQKPTKLGFILSILVENTAASVVSDRDREADGFRDANDHKVGSAEESQVPLSHLGFTGCGRPR